MDNDYPVDIEEILRVVQTAEVIVFRFVLVTQRLIIDPRSNEQDGPLIKLVPPARSAEDRFRTLRQLRPRFSHQEKIIASHWPKFVARLEDSGVWAGISERVLAPGFAGTQKALDDVLTQLRRLERREIQNALSGKGYETIWHK